MAFPSKHAVKAPGALVRAGVETSSDRVRELATDEMLTVEEVKWSSKGVARRGGVIGFRDIYGEI